MKKLLRAVTSSPAVSAASALASRRRAVLSNAGEMSAYFCTRARMAAKSALASGPHGALYEIVRGWSQSIPTARIVLSSSQRCSVQRRVCISARAPAEDLVVTAASFIVGEIDILPAAAD